MNFLPTRTRICLDFDGVLSEYKGEYKGPHTHGKPLPGVKHFLDKLREAGIEIVVLTTKDSHSSIREWFEKYDLTPPDAITSHKVPASAYVDDRAVYFDGNFEHLLQNLSQFHVHWNEKRPFKKLGEQ